MKQVDAVSILTAAVQRLAVGKHPPPAESAEARELMLALALLASDARLEDLADLGAHTLVLLKLYAYQRVGGAVANFEAIKLVRFSAT